MKAKCHDGGRCKGTHQLICSDHGCAILAQRAAMSETPLTDASVFSEWFRNTPVVAAYVARKLELAKTALERKNADLQSDISKLNLELAALKLGAASRAGVVDLVDGLQTENASLRSAPKLEAECAAMREALEKITKIAWGHEGDCGADSIAHGALDSIAGAAILERLRIAEADRDHWKANAKNQAEIRRVTLTRPDLKDRSEYVQQIIAERDAAKACTDRLGAALREAQDALFSEANRLANNGSSPFESRVETALYDAANKAKAALAEWEASK